MIIAIALVSYHYALNFSVWKARKEAKMEKENLKREKKPKKKISVAPCIGSSCHPLLLPLAHVKIAFIYYPYRYPYCIYSITFVPS